MPTPGRRAWLDVLVRHRAVSVDNIQRALQWTDDEEERRDLLQARQRLEKKKRKPSRSRNKQQLIKELWDGYAGFFQDAPLRPYCTDDPSLGQQIRPLQTAVKRRHIQPNPPGMVHWLVFDIDRSDAADAWRVANLPKPQLVVVNPENGHAHMAWRLGAPVCTTNAARAKPMRYVAATQEAMRLALGADPGYRGGLMKNPVHDAWKTIVANVRPYTLAELTAGLDLQSAANADQAREADVAGLGRNCSMFTAGRLWAYGAISAYWGPSGYDLWYQAVMRHLQQLNSQFHEPLASSEVAATAKSIARWTWRNITPTGRAELIARTHTPKLQAERGRAGGIAKGARYQQQREKARQMWEEGHSYQRIAETVGVSRRSAINWCK